MAGQNGRITLRDIAEELGVSIGTVDRALHDRPDVNPETKMKILEHIQKQNYKTNKIAKSLSLGSKKIKIGIISQSGDMFYWEQLINGAKSAESNLSDFGLEIVIREIGDDRKLQEILHYIDELSELKVNAIALLPINDTSLVDKVNQLHDIGIPVATLNDDIEGSARLFYVGPQISQTGRIAAELMGRFLCNNGRVITISHAGTSFEQRKRMESFSTTVNDRFTGIDIIGDITISYPSMKKNLHEHLIDSLESFDNVDGIYDISGGYLYEVANAVRAIRQLKGITLIGHEFWSGVQDYMYDGTISACISQDPYSQGFHVVKMLYEYLTEKKLPPFDRMYTRIDILMSENIKNHDQLVNPYYY